MQQETILLSEYCEYSRVELDFILSLEEEGLIEVEVHNNLKYIHLSQLNDLERFIRLHYDLAINIEGLDVIHNLLSRINEMQQELDLLRREFRGGSLEMPR